MPHPIALRHIALNVKDPQASKLFYMKVLGMTIAWEPDPQNVYLTTDGSDSLAIHCLEASLNSKQSVLDHIGFFLKSLQDLRSLYDHLVKNQIPILKEIKTHRDGSTSFYCNDPDGIVVQFLVMPNNPVA